MTKMRTKYHALGATLLTVLMAVPACSLLDPPPNDAQALEALRDMGSLTGMSLPPMFSIAAVSVNQCTRQSKPDGHVCDVVLVSQELPILGVIKFPIQMRFIKRDSKWVAFLS